MKNIQAKSIVKTEDASILFFSFLCINTIKEFVDTASKSATNIDFKKGLNNCIIKNKVIAAIKIIK